MSTGITKVEFDSSSMNHVVQQLNCGADRWEIEVSEWIKGRPADDCVDSAGKRGTRTWIFADSSGRLVGYSSLGKTELRFPDKKSPKIVVSVIPMLGVDTNFRGIPPKPAPSYAQQILDDTISEAEATGSRALLLFVDIQNTRAIRFYRRNQFVDFPPVYQGKYLRLIRKME